MIVTVNVGGLRTTVPYLRPAAADAAESVLGEEYTDRTADSNSGGFEEAFGRVMGAFGVNPIHTQVAMGMLRNQAGNIRRAAANLASNNGSNIAGIHAQEGQVANMMDLANMSRSPDAVQAHPELAAVDRLLLKYFYCVVRNNGVLTTNDLNDDVAELLDSQSFGLLVNNTFGCFNIVDQPTFLVYLPVVQQGEL